ncbi:hypothetical protein JOF56_010437 [Kibdelosporangium banguiense]|uniref:Uncharacterized protein n=1 Tax=Kibdelosporangium banguiense TaxID=1365924 RepID=A0ABS4U076_9PSEU|nr:hypothetical protein [Kibdelosporangium banguiense]MBP2330052.1 hypothetical protein [Kibdelosporangium banguiense]
MPEGDDASGVRMGETDPHIHVGARLNADAMSRDLIASTFGLVSDLPAVVETGCGLEGVPRAMTSPLPERVTCLACREYASREYLRFAEQTERLSGTPGLAVSDEQMRLAADHFRELAHKFS